MASGGEQTSTHTRILPSEHATPTGSSGRNWCRRGGRRPISSGCNAVRLRLSRWPYGSAQAARVPLRHSSHAMLLACCHTSARRQQCVPRDVTSCAPQNRCSFASRAIAIRLRTSCPRVTATFGTRNYARVLSRLGTESAPLPRQNLSESDAQPRRQLRKSVADDVMVLVRRRDVLIAAL